MFYIPTIDDYLKIFSDEEVKDFVAINFSDYFRSTKEEENLIKVYKSLYIFLATPDEVEKKRSQRWLNFETLRCGAYWRAALIRGRYLIQS